MKASDLRIGNWVNIFLNDVDYNTIQIKVDDLYYIIQKNGVYEPIPLTEEWLEKFGFDIKDKNRLDWVKGAFNLERSYEDNNKFWFEVYSHYIPLDYVHQFQNLYFALTGEELIIKE